MSDGIEIHDTTETEAARQAMLEHLDATPNEKLRQLIEQYRELGEELTQENVPMRDQGHGERCLLVADELEELIDGE